MIKNVTVHATTFEVDISSFQLYFTALEYLNIFNKAKDSISVGFQYFLLCRSIELFLKAYLKKSLNLKTENIKDRYGHNLNLLFETCTELNIQDQLHYTQNNMNTIKEQIHKTYNYYEHKQFEYPSPKLIVKMISGYPNLPDIHQLKAFVTDLEKLIKPLV